MTPVTPIKQSPLLLLQNAVEVCTAYGDEKNVSASSAQQQLGRIRGLILQALAALGEPSPTTVEMVAHWLGTPADRTCRDFTAAVQHHMMTWGIGDDL